MNDTSSLDMDRIHLTSERHTPLNCNSPGCSLLERLCRNTATHRSIYERPLMLITYTRSNFMSARAEGVDEDFM